MKRKRDEYSSASDGSSTKLGRISPNSSDDDSSTGESSSSSLHSSRRNPQESLISMLKEEGCNPEVVSSQSLPDFFAEVTEEEIQAYDAEALRAIREADMETLRRFLDENRPLKCSNQFGESLLHLACRKSLITVVTFLVDEANVPLNVRDDMGRSPLHDAFWCPEVNFELVDLILQRCPDLLMISDKRGHPPLAYARKQHWKSWNTFLQSRSDIIKTIRIGTSDTTSSSQEESD
eukprot:scaffold1934_cov79-Cylindrotheca_fusiformis.AAC.6